jgi:hypothetical protein
MGCYRRAAALRLLRNLSLLTFAYRRAGGQKAAYRLGIRLVLLFFGQHHHGSLVVAGHGQHLAALRPLRRPRHGLRISQCGHFIVFSGNEQPWAIHVGRYLAAGSSTGRSGRVRW